MTRKKSEINVGKKEPKQVSISIGYKKSEVALRQRGPYTYVVIKEGVPIGKPGQPALPWRKFYVSVPWDAVPGELIIKDTKIATLAEGITIEPCQPDVPTLLGTEVEWVMPDRELYASEVIWPEVFARVTTVRRTGGFAMAELEICPFRYHLNRSSRNVSRRWSSTPKTFPPIRTLRRWEFRPNARRIHKLTT